MIAEMPLLPAPARAHTQERTCPRCGRPIERGPKAKWCSDDCRVRAWQEEHWMGKRAGKVQGYPPNLEMARSTVITVPNESQERASGEAGMLLDAPQPGLAVDSNGNGAGTTETAVAAVQAAFRRRQRAGAGDAILRRVRLFQARVLR